MWRPARLLASSLLLCACAPDITPVREGEPLWVFIEAQQGDTVHELWAIDISEPDTVLARDRLIHVNSYNGIWIRGETPWGASVVSYETESDGWHSQQLRLDELGNPELVPVAPAEIDGLLSPTFTADGRRMLTSLGLGLAGAELWVVEFDDGQPIAGDRLAKLDGEDASIRQHALLPGDAGALWIEWRGEAFAPSELMFAPLVPELGPARSLDTVPAWSFTFAGDKLAFFTPNNEMWLLPLDDLDAEPTPGPTPDTDTEVHGTWSDDGRWLCVLDWSEVGVIEFTGLSFGEHTVVSSAEQPGGLAGCFFPRTDVLIYGGVPNTPALGLAMVDLSGTQPSAPMPVTSPASSGISGYRVSPNHDRLAYVARDTDTDRVELTDISGSSPGVPVVLLDSALDAGWLEFIDDQRLLFRATVDSTADLYLVDLDSDAPTPVRLDGGKPTGHDIQSFAATPDGDAVVVTLRDSGSSDDFLWRVGTDGSETAMQLSLEAGWTLGAMGFLSGDR